MSESAIDLQPQDIRQMFIEKKATGVISVIRESFMSEVPDIDTVKGRKRLASNANKVSSLKTMIDAEGKELVANMKQKCKLIDSQRKEIRDELDSIRDQVKSPLIAWREEQKKEEFRLKVLQEITDCYDEAHALNDLFNIDLQKKEGERVALEREQAALREKEIQERVKKEKEELRIEMEQQQKQKEAREAQERADAETARIEKELRAKIEEENRVKKEKEEAERVKQEEIKEAEYRARKEQARVYEEKRKQEAIEAEKKALQDKKAFRKKVLNEVLISVQSFTKSKADAKSLILEIEKGNIPYLNITYSKGDRQ